MNTQEYDRSGRLSKEDELMMNKPTSNLSCDKDAPEPPAVLVRENSVVLIGKVALRGIAPFSVCDFGENHYDSGAFHPQKKCLVYL